MFQVHYVRYISFSQSRYYIHFMLDMTIEASASKYHEGPGAVQRAGDPSHNTRGGDCKVQMEGWRRVMQ